MSLSANETVPVLGIRPMTLDDLPEVVRNETRAYVFPWAQEQIVDSITSGHLCRVFLEDRHIVGHGIVTHGAGEAHLLNLCVARDRQRCGYGRLLLHSLLEDMNRIGIMTVFLEVRVSNQVAIRLYESVGFVEIGLYPNYYPAEKGCEDARVMALELLA